MIRFFLGMLVAGSLAAATLPVPVSAQNVPSGSYQQSCRGVVMDQNMLSARCTTANGSLVRTEINVRTCRNGDIANDNGQLACHRNNNGRNNGNDNNGNYNNGNYNNGNYNNGNYNSGNGYNTGYAPPGSYTSSCRNVIMKNGMLSAECTNPNGQWVSSTLDPNGCRGNDIANMNGQLRCSGNAAPSGYNGYGLPGGSYQMSCTNSVVQGRVLTATCPSTNGTRVTTTLDVSRCRADSDISNINGRLECLVYR